jgi:hypothetical protein
MHLPLFLVLAQFVCVSVCLHVLFAAFISLGFGPCSKFSIGNISGSSDILATHTGLCIAETSTGSRNLGLGFRWHEVIAPIHNTCRSEQTIHEASSCCFDNQL